MYIMLGITFLFVVLRFVIRYLKWDWLIAGYNTMSKEKKQEIDIEGLRTFLGNSMFIIAAIFLVAFLFDYMGQNTSALIAFYGLIAYVIFMMFYGQRFNHNKKDQRKGTIVAAAILILSGAFVFGMMLYGGGEPEISVTAQEITIGGMYGTTVYTSELQEVQLVDNLPRITARTNGYAVGNILKGYFRLEEYGKAKLFLVSYQGPFLLLRDSENLFIINYEDTSKTEALFELIAGKSN